MSTVSLADFNLEANVPCALKAIGIVKTNTGVCVHFLKNLPDVTQKAQNTLIPSLVQHEIAVFI